MEMSCLRQELDLYRADRSQLYPTPGITVMKPLLTLTHECTWEQALAPHSKSVLYTLVRALEIKRQQLLYIHPEGQLRRLGYQGMVGERSYSAGRSDEAWRKGRVEIRCLCGLVLLHKAASGGQNKYQFLLDSQMENSLKSLHLPSLTRFPVLIWEVFTLHVVSATSQARMFCSPLRCQKS